jgi:hypothetical protein
LLELDVLAIDKFGVLPVQLLAVIDIILRRLQNSNLPFGGVLLICTMDHLQIQAFNDRPVLLSPHALTCFDMFVLRQSVRARDAPLHRIQDITRLMLHELTLPIIQEFTSLVEENFVFVSKDEDAPLNYV